MVTDREIRRPGGEFESTTGSVQGKDHERCNQYFTNLWGVGGSQGRGAPSIEYRAHKVAQEQRQKDKQQALFDAMKAWVTSRVKIPRNVSVVLYVCMEWTKGCCWCVRLICIVRAAICHLLRNLS